LERSLLLLNDIPGVLATSTIQPGAGVGESDIVVKLSNSPFYNGSIDFDNHGSISTGESRLTANLNFNNPGGFGDHLSVKGLSSLNNNYGRVGYTFPVGYDGLRAGVSFSYLHYELGGDLKDLNAGGNALTTGILLSKPLIRSRTGNLYATINYDYRMYDNSAGGSETSNKSIHSGSGGMSGDRYDSLLGGGYTSLGITATVGNTDLSANTTDFSHDQLGPKVDGNYQKMSYNLTRLQNLYQNKITMIGLNGQVSFKNLDSSEKMSLGGPTAVRAFPSSEGNGDSGLTLTTELRQNITDSIQLFGFYDFGWIQQYTKTWDGWNTSSAGPNSYTLDGIGLGAAWALAGVASIKLTVAERLGNNPGMNAKGKDSDGTKREPHFWFLASYYF
jgi:hemolysin activation/secretion protein